MFNGTSGLTPSDVLALGNTDGFGNGSGWWFIIILFLLFGGFNNGWGGNSGAADNYVLASDFATLQRQIDSTTSDIKSQCVSIGNGISSLGYDQLARMDGIGTTIMQSTNAIQSQMAECCCGNKSAIADLNYNLATQSNVLNNAINNGFCQTNFNAQTNTRDIVDSQNAGTQAILTKLSQMESNAQAEKIATLQAENQRLAFAESQAQQNNVLINALRPSPIPAYITSNPYCNCQGYYGTTIA